MIKKRFRFVIPALLVLSLAGTSLALAGSQGDGPKLKFKHNGGSGALHADLSGRQEVPVVRTAGKGHFTLTMTNATSFSYELSYTGLSGNAILAHIHFGQPGASGGVLVDICGTPGKPTCPTGTAATITGTIAAADIKALAAQGFPTAGDFAGFVEELRAGLMYVNVHTAQSPSGEIRGQIAGKGFFGHHDNGWHKGWFKD